jgi:CDP-diacylglycerol--glycerol-3-phosphate 3-phosphatidyltransferase
MSFQLMPHRPPPAVVGPIVRALAAAGVTPNAVSLVGFLGNVAAAVLVASGWLVAGGLVLLVASALDFLDGGLARATGRSTKFGGVLDSTLDRLSEAVLLFGVQWYAIERGLAQEALLAFVAVVGSLMVSYVRARVEAAGGQMTDGIFTRPERVVVMVAALVTGYLRVGLWVLAVVSVFTAAQRLYLAQAAVSDAPPAGGPRSPRAGSARGLAGGKE